MTRLGYVLLVAAVAIMAIVGTALLAFTLTSGDAESVSYRLRAETMIPLDGSVDAGSVDCPVGSTSSPLAFNPTGVLAEELPLYEDELIAVRVVLSRFKGSLPESVSFDARWPETVVAGSPTCAFLVSESPGASATLSWESIEGGATFTIEDSESLSTATVEIWLTSAEPVPQTAFWTTLTTPETGDNVVIDPLGGRVTVDERSGNSAQLVLEHVGPSVEDGKFEVMATVSNPDQGSSSRVLDAKLSVEASEVTWMLASAIDSVECETGAAFVCSVGDLLPGEEIVVVAVGSVPDGWRPQPVTCRTSQASSGVGLCVTGSVAADGVPSADVPTTRVLVEAEASSGGPLVFAPEFTPFVVRSTETSDLRLLLTTSSPGIAAVEIIDSDCLDIVRVESQLDDGDAFLVPGETWVYSCRVERSESGVVRIDLAAVDGGLEPLSASIDVPISVIDPRLDVAVVNPIGSESDVAIDVTNGGVGDLFEIALTTTGCESVEVAAGPTARLLEGETVRFRCVVGDADFDPSTIVAYATDLAGLPVLGTP